MTIGYFTPRRRSRPLGLARNARALAIAFAVSAAGGSVAQASSTAAGAVVFVSMDGTQTVKQGQDFRAEGDNFNQVIAVTPGNSAQFGIATSQIAGGLFSTDARASLGIRPGTGVTIVEVNANESVSDRIMVLGAAPNDDRAVVLHTTLNFGTSNLPGFSTDIEGSGRFLASGSGHFNLSMIDGNGSLIDLARPDGNVFQAETFSFDGHTQRRSSANTDSVDIAIRLNLGQAHDIAFSIADVLDLSFDNIDGSQSALFSGIFGHTLNFSPAVTITDTEGNALCGLSVGSQTGFNFGSTAACGDTGGGTIGGAGGVPEPTSWALLIAGFGGVGAMLRRRRAPQPA